MKEHSIKAMNKTDQFYNEHSIKYFIEKMSNFTCTVKPKNKGHPREKLHMVFIDKWSSFGGYSVLFYQGRVIEV